MSQGTTFLIPATTVPAASTVDLLFQHMGGSQAAPVLLAPAGALDPSWAGVTWTAWLQPQPSGDTAMSPIVVRIANVTASAINLAAQEFAVRHVL